MPTLTPQTLHDVSRDIFLAMGSAAPEAEMVADHLVRANLAGHDSHGVGMLPTYVRLHREGRLVMNQTLRTVVDSGPILVLDAAQGVGQRLTAEAVERACIRAKELGVCLLALRDAGHIGRVGTYGELCAAQGLVFVAFANVASGVTVQAIWGAATSSLGTNPFTVAVPRAGHPPVLLDMATTAIAFGKARVAQEAGKPLPDGAAIDAQGHPTKDPAGLVLRREGALLSFGQYKGSGLAVMCELLGGALTGGLRADNSGEGGVTNSMLAFIFDPARLGADNAAIEAVCQHVTSGPVAPGHATIQVPGEPELASADRRSAHGIDLDAASWSDVRNAAESVGVRVT